jgi:hypothetical protein
MKIRDLKTGNKVKVAGLDMTFSYMSGKHPAFIHEVNGAVVTYINKAYNSETLLTDIK